MSLLPFPFDALENRWRRAKRVKVMQGSVTGVTKSSDVLHRSDGVHEEVRVRLEFVYSFPGDDKTSASNFERQFDSGAEASEFLVGKTIGCDVNVYYRDGFSSVSLDAEDFYRDVTLWMYALIALLAGLSVFGARRLLV